MILQTFVFMILVACAVGEQDDFQQRMIYLSESDNVCHFRQASDKIKVDINQDGGLRSKHFVGNGNTGCSEWVLFDSQRIYPAKSWTVYGEDYKKDALGFIEETKRYSAGGVLLAIVQKTRVKNPVTLDGLPYSCRLYGDGRIQHFGTEFPNVEPSRIYLACEKVSTEPQPELQAS